MIFKWNIFQLKCLQYAQDLFSLGLWSHCSCLSNDLPCLETFPSRALFFLYFALLYKTQNKYSCTFYFVLFFFTLHLKAHSYFMAKDTKEHGIHPLVLRTTNESNSCRATTQKTGFLLLHYQLSWCSKKHSYGFSLNFIQFCLDTQKCVSNEPQICSATDLKTTGLGVYTWLQYFVCPSLILSHLPSNFLPYCSIYQHHTQGSRTIKTFLATLCNMNAGFRHTAWKRLMDLNIYNEKS